MAFKPKDSGNRGNGGNFEDTRNLPVPRAGSRKARVSLIVDLGVQEREDFEDPNTGEVKPQKPCQQIAAFADLVADRVDYGGNIGKQQYRLMLNKSFMGEIQGVNFQCVPPTDAKGKRIDGKPWGFHPANLLTKLAKAVGREDIAVDDPKGKHSLDISQLLNLPFMAQVEVKETESKDKKDDEGNPIVYKNVNFKGATSVPEDDDGNPIEVAELDAEPLCITFDDAKPEHIKFIRAGLLKKIKLAKNYAGSQMEKAIQAFEAEDGGDEQGEQEDKPAEKEKPKATAKKPAATKKPAPAPAEEEDSDLPF